MQETRCHGKNEDGNIPDAHMLCKAETNNQDLVVVLVFRFITMTCWSRLSQRILFLPSPPYIDRAAEVIKQCDATC